MRPKWKHQKTSAYMPTAVQTPLIATSEPITTTEAAEIQGK